MALDVVILSIIIGTLAAIVYSLRVLVLLERRISRIDVNIERIASRIMKEELLIETEEKDIERKLGVRSKSKRKVAKKKITKKKRK